MEEEVAALAFFAPLPLSQFMGLIKADLFSYYSSPSTIIQRSGTLFMLTGRLARVIRPRRDLSEG